MLDSAFFKTSPVASRGMGSVMSIDAQSWKYIQDRCTDQLTQKVTPFWVAGWRWCERVKNRQSIAGL